MRQLLNYQIWKSGLVKNDFHSLATEERTYSVWHDEGHPLEHSSQRSKVMATVKTARDRKSQESPMDTDSSQMLTTVLNSVRTSASQCCVWAGLTHVLISTEICDAVVTSSSRVNLRVGMDWAVGGVALTNTTLSSDPTIRQLFATFTAVKILSPVWTKHNDQYKINHM